MTKSALKTMFIGSLILAAISLAKLNRSTTFENMLTDGAMTVALALIAGASLLSLQVSSEDKQKKKFTVCVAVVLVGALVYFALDAGKAEQIRKKERNLRAWTIACSEGIDTYAKSHNGQYPCDLSPGLLAQIETAAHRYSATMPTEDWFVVAHAHSVAEFISAAECAEPGKIVYCPVQNRKNSKTADGYLLLGKQLSGHLQVCIEGLMVIRRGVAEKWTWSQQRI